MNLLSLLADINLPVALVLCTAMIVIGVLAYTKTIPPEVIEHGLSVLAGIFVGGTSSLVRNYHTGNTMRPPPMSNIKP